jgi:ATP-dependent RNA helicase DDX51/DBP6
LLVLPTRDLCVQVLEIFQTFIKGTKLKVAASTGELNLAEERTVLVGNIKEKLLGGRSSVDIYITTPGRLIDHILSTPNFTLQHLRFLVIDEADRLLNAVFRIGYNIFSRPFTRLNHPFQHYHLKTLNIQFKLL